MVFGHPNPYHKDFVASGNPNHLVLEHWGCHAVQGFEVVFGFGRGLMA